MSLIPDAVLKRRPGTPIAYKLSFGCLMGSTDGWSKLEDLWLVKYREKRRICPLSHVYWIHHLKEHKKDKQTEKWTIYSILPDRYNRYVKLDDPWVRF